VTQIQNHFLKKWWGKINPLTFLIIKIKWILEQVLYRLDTLSVSPKQWCLSAELIDWVKVLCPTRHKIGNFGDILSSHSWHSTEKTKPNTTKTNRRKKQSKLQQKNTQNAKLKQTHKLNLNLKPTVNCKELWPLCSVHNSHTKHSTDQLWKFSLLSSRQSP